MSILRPNLVMITALVYALGATLAQSAQELAFDAVSVRASTSHRGRGNMGGGPGTNDPGRLTFTNVTLFNVLLRAYDLRAFQISAPEWMLSRSTISSPPFRQALRRSSAIGC
jgi:hypothetical protein